MFSKRGIVKIEMNDKLLEIDNYNIFDLLGLSSLSKEHKQKMLFEINEMIWNDFLINRLGVILTQDQYLSVKDLIEKNTPVKEILQYIAQKVPNFNQLLAEFTRRAKVEFIKAHFVTTISDLQKSREVSKDERIKEKLFEKLDKYHQALDLVDENQWEQITKLFQ